jgi:hypothetical protein
LIHRVQVIPKGHKFELVGEHLETHTIELDLDNQAYLLINGQRTDRKGTWSMIYDQSLTIVLDQGGPAERITANFKFTIKDAVPVDQWASKSTGDFSSFDSICSETMVGFWQAPDF